MKHGPIALIDQFMPVVVIAPTSDPNYLKLQSNIEEVLARGGSVIAITEEGNDELDAKCECVVKVGDRISPCSPYLCICRSPHCTSLYLTASPGHVPFSDSLRLCVVIRCRVRRSS